MKRVICIIFSLALMIALSACSVSFPARKPTEGIWYCEELRISIDFGIYQSELTSQCAKLHNGDGTTTEILCHIDYGRGIGLVSEDHETYYLVGKFYYRQDTFTVKSNEDGTKYVFVQIDNE